VQAPSACPIKELFLLVPSISRWQWHPITVAGTSADKDTGGSVHTLNIKRYGKWTKVLSCHHELLMPLRLLIAVRTERHSRTCICCTLAWQGD
jgi:hypothetical protein